TWAGGAPVPAPPPFREPAAAPTRRIDHRLGDVMLIAVGQRRAVRPLGLERRALGAGEPQRGDERAGGAGGGARTLRPAAELWARRPPPAKASNADAGVQAVQPDRVGQVAAI